MFECTSDLRGRVYPSPGSTHIFVLDFIDRQDMRFLTATGLILYDAGDLGDEPRREVETSDGLIGRKGPIELYYLNPRRVVH